MQNSLRFFFVVVASFKDLIEQIPSMNFINGDVMSQCQRYVLEARRTGTLQGGTTVMGMSPVQGGHRACSRGPWEVG